MNYLGSIGSGFVPRVRRLQCAIRLSAWLFVFSIPAAAAEPGSGSIAGAITSATTRNALQGATVTVPVLRRT